MTIDRGSQRDAEALLAEAAHELRTPIATICGLVELLRAHEQPPASADRAEMWDALWRQSRRLRAFVDDLFDVARLDGVSVAPSTVVPVDRAIADALESAPPPAEIAVAVSVFGLPGGAPLRVRIEPHALPRVLVNLLTNAYRYGAATITLLAARQGPFVTMIIDDDGPGVPGDISATMFEPFVRGSNSDGHRGLGIGLSLARQIVENAGGRLSYTRRDPVGSTFVIELPFVECDDTEDKATMSATDGSASLHELEPDRLAIGQLIDAPRLGDHRDEKEPASTDGVGWSR